jgi:O-antigen ligase
MIPFFRQHLHRPAQWMFLCACLLVLSILTSPFILSLSMIGMVAVAIWQARLESTSWAAVPGRMLRAWWGQPALLALSLLLLAPALSYFWSENTHFWAGQTRVRLPFLILPLAFANAPTLSRWQYRSVLYLLVWVMLILCIGVGIHFYLHQEQIISDLQHGRPIPVPRNHIRFNLLLATAILSGGWLWWQRFVWKYAWERTLLAATLVFLFLFIHLLSVRSGLAALYAALLYSVVFGIVRYRKWKLGLAALCLMALMPVVAFETMPSLRNRVYYMWYDWQKFRENAGGEYSDAMRWVSLEIGIQLWQQHPVLGVGAGDLPVEVQTLANEQYPNYTLDTKLPHNQWIYILCSTGLLGFLMSLIAILAPLGSQSARRLYLFMAFQVMIFISFLVEYTLETAIGVAFYLFFTLWFRTMARAEQEY